MFVGVVVENFHRCRAELEREERAASRIKKARKVEERIKRNYIFWSVMQRLTFNYSGLMDRPSYVDFNPLRLVLYRLVTSKYFDLAISAVIGLNVITMAMEFYMMPDVSSLSDPDELRLFEADPH